MKVSLKQVEEVLSSIKSATAEQVANELGLNLTQENRKDTLTRIRRLCRTVVNRAGGIREEYNEDKQLIYSIE